MVFSFARAILWGWLGALVMFVPTSSLLSCSMQVFVFLELTHVMLNI
jgi:hypothetical protein